MTDTSAPVSILNWISLGPLRFLVEGLSWLSASGMTDTSAPVSILNWIGTSLRNRVIFHALQLPEDSTAPKLVTHITC